MLFLLLLFLFLLVFYCLIYLAVSRILLLPLRAQQRSLSLQIPIRLLPIPHLPRLPMRIGNFIQLSLRIILD
nr:MAG TPA: hypothetical protein [Caudoviricetes sp.]